MGNAGGGIRIIFAEGREAVREKEESLMPEREQIAETTLQLKRVFKAPREKVFNAWTDPKQMKQWIIPQDGFSVPNVEVDFRVGGKYRIEMLSPNGICHTAVGSYREIVVPEKLVFTWFWENRPEEGETLFTVEFYEQGIATQVLLTHELFQNETVRDDHNKGWSGALNQLAKFLSI
jgi:uncharacterized protein YndB with AHSA1/START domain